ncbi:MAG: hypothetical protein ABIK31_03090, partial [candidate division WOR-3 bacterium]
MKKQYKLKIILPLLILLIIISTLLLIYVSFKETINNYLQQKALSMISKAIKSQIRVQTIKGNILYGIELTDVAFIVPSGDSITAQKIYLSYRLLSFITPQENKINKLVIT